MSLRTWLLTRLEPILGSSQIDPDLMVELTTVQPFEVPIIQQALADAGVGCRVSETIDVIAMQERSCVMVKQGDLATANQALADLRR